MTRSACGGLARENQAGKAHCLPLDHAPQHDDAAFGSTMDSLVRASFVVVRGAPQRTVIYFHNLGRITTSQANSNMSGYDEPTWLSQQTDDKKEVIQDANTGGNLSAPEPE